MPHAYQLYPPPPPVGAVPGAYFNHESHLRVGHNQVLLSMVGPDGPHGMWLSFAVRNFRKWLLFTVAVINQYTVPLEWNGECNKLCASEEHNFEFCIMCL